MDPQDDPGKMLAAEAVEQQYQQPPPYYQQPPQHYSSQSSFQQYPHGLNQAPAYPPHASQSNTRPVSYAGQLPQQQYSQGQGHLDPNAHYQAAGYPGAPQTQLQPSYASSAGSSPYFQPAQPANPKPPTPLPVREKPPSAVLSVYSNNPSGSTTGNASSSSRPSSGVPTQPRRIRHEARCDGCGMNPLRGVRWRCQTCADEDICDRCKDSGIRRSHLLKVVEPWVETHGKIFCDGCKRCPIYGVRRHCQVHKDEDWCEECFKAGRACKGPHIVVGQTPLGLYIETYAMAPLPETWLSKMGPPAALFFISISGDGNDWTRRPSVISWYDAPVRDRAEFDKKRRDIPLYKAELDKTGGMVRDKKYEWNFSRVNPAERLYTYVYEKNRKSGDTATEYLGTFKGPTVPAAFSRTPQGERFEFSLPSGGKQYVWITNKPVSTIKGERWDSVRYALYERSSASDVIVADYAFWDGHLDAPEDCLAIRDPKISHALVLSSLTAALFRSWKILDAEIEANKSLAEEAERQARLTSLGRQAYWKSTDVYRKLDKKSALNERLQTVSGLLDANSNVVQLLGSMDGGSGGDGGGGGGGDGGGGGGGGGGADGGGGGGGA